jgi:hypothetical protein
MTKKLLIKTDSTANSLDIENKINSVVISSTKKMTVKRRR